MLDSLQHLAPDEMSTKPFPRWQVAGIALFILGFALVLRVWALGGQSLWFDEGWSWHLARLPLDQMAATTAGDRSPVLYYALLHGWIAFAGDSEFAMRYLSVFADEVTVAALLAFASALTARRSRGYFLAALLYSICPFAVWYAQETRMYAGVAALCVLSCYWLWRWLNAPSRLRFLVSSAGLMILAVHTHYYAVFLLPAQGLATLAVLMMRRKPLTLALKWLASSIVVLLLLLPWLYYASIGFAYDDGFIFPLNTVAGRLNDWLVAFASGGLSRSLPDWWIASMAFLLIVGLIGYMLARKWQALVFVLTLGCITLLAATLAVRLVYPYRSVFHPRYLIYVAPFAIMLGAGMFASTHSPKWQVRWLNISRTISLVVCGVLWLPGLYAMYTDPRVARDDVRDATQHVVEALQPGDLVVMTRDHYAVRYYLQRFYPEQAAAFTAMPEGLHGVLKTDTDFLEILRQRNPQRVRLFLWQDDVVDPQRLVESSLWVNGYEIGELDYKQIRLPLYQLQKTPVQAPLFQPVGAVFDKKLKLSAMWMRQEGRAGDWFYVVLDWIPQQRLSTNYKVFVHVENANGHTVFQRDKLPLNDLMPMMTWTTGNSMRDAYAMVIPPTLHAGEYRVSVGVYDPADEALRLPVVSSAQPISNDAIIIGTLVVRTQ